MNMFTDQAHCSSSLKMYIDHGYWSYLLDMLTDHVYCKASLLIKLLDQAQWTWFYRSSSLIKLSETVCWSCLPGIFTVHIYRSYLLAILNTGHIYWAGHNYWMWVCSDRIRVCWSLWGVCWSLWGVCWSLRTCLLIFIPVTNSTKVELKEFFPFFFSPSQVRG